MAIKYSRKLMILDVEGLRVPTAAEKTQIAKQWAKSSQKKRGKSKSDYTYDVTTGQFVTKSTASQKNIRLLQNRIKQLAAENRQLRRREMELRNRMADIERELEEREAQGDAASYTSEGYDQDAADTIHIDDHNFEGAGGYNPRDDTIRLAKEFYELLQELTLLFGTLRMLYLDAGLPEDEPFGAAIDYDNLYARFKSITNVWNNFDDKIHGSPEELGLREFLYNNKDTLNELKDAVNEAIREGRKWINSHRLK